MLPAINRVGRPFTEEELTIWHTILKEEHIDEKAAANAFYRKARGKNVAPVGSRQSPAQSFNYQYLRRPVGGPPVGETALLPLFSSLLPLCPLSFTFLLFLSLFSLLKIAL